jgi:hypothetical protein
MIGPVNKPMIPNAFTPTEQRKEEANFQFGDYTLMWIVKSGPSLPHSGNGTLRAKPHPR